MRHAARRLFTLAAATSLLLFLAVILFWLRSHWQSENLTWRSSTGQNSLGTRQGYLVLHYFHADWSNQPTNTFGLKYDTDLAAPPSQDLFVRLMLGGNRGDKHTYWEHAGFGWWHYRRLDGVRNITAVAPFWSLALITAILPLIWTTRRLRAKLRPTKEKTSPRCPTCGYDLRATPTRCPECGKIPQPPTPASREAAKDLSPSA